MKKKESWFQLSFFLFNVMTNLRNTLPLLIFILVFTVACGTAPADNGQSQATENSPQEDSDAEAEAGTEENSLILDPSATADSYPAPSNDNDLPYPPPSPQIDDEAYPVATIIPKDESKRFTITSTIMVGDTTVAGTGPANIGITVVNLGDISVPLGVGRTDSDGNFSINVTPIEKGMVVALMVGAGVSEDDFRDAAGVTDIPFIGLVLTQTIVNE